jgi:amidase
MNIVFSTTPQLAAAIRLRQIAATEVLEAHLTQIEQYNSTLSAVLTHRNSKNFCLFIL